MYLEAVFDFASKLYKDIYVKICSCSEFHLQSAFAGDC